MTTEDPTNTTDPLSVTKPKPHVDARDYARMYGASVKHA